MRGWVGGWVSSVKGWVIISLAEKKKKRKKKKTTTADSYNGKEMSPSDAVSNSKHCFMTSFLWKKVPESDARSVTHFLTD